MAKPTGKLVFDRSNALMSGFHSGTTASDYSGNTFEWETTAATTTGTMVNPVWEQDKGFVSQLSQARDYYVDDKPPDYYLNEGAILCVWETNGSTVNNGAVLRLIGGSGTFSGPITLRTDTNTISCFGNVLSVTTDANVGGENAMCIRMVPPTPQAGDGNLYSHVYSQVNNTANNPESCPSWAWANMTQTQLVYSNIGYHISPNAILKTMCFVTGTFSDADASNFVSDPWQIVKQEGGEPTAGNAVIVGANF